MMKELVTIGKKTIGPGEPAYIIAEIGSNHDSSITRAKELVEAAKEAGADAVKLQSFTAEGLINPLKPDGDGGWTAHPAYPVLKGLEVPGEWHWELKEFADHIGVDLLSAPFDEQRAELLDEIGVEAMKIASGDLTNEPLLRKAASFGRPMIVSTGAAYLEEVRRAVEVITSAGNEEIALLHCASLYPPSYTDVNVRCVATLWREFRCPVGISDHTPGHSIPVAAVTLGASVIEKHITLDRAADGPDHGYAMEVDEFARMVEEIRNVEAALGDGVKRPSENEMPERVGARRSIYAKVDIKKGTVIGPEMVKVVRHAYGLEPGELGSVVGTAAARDLARDLPIRREDICR